MYNSPQTIRMKEVIDTDALSGQVAWSPSKSIWYSCHLVVALIGGAFTFSISSVLVFLVTSTVVLCLGHSLGMHRRLIHRSYKCKLWIEYLFVYFGVLTGLGGPYGMIYQHDLRDWAQRKECCHKYLMHGSNIWRDAWWQIHCDIILDDPPEFVLEQEVVHSRIYRFLESTWMLQQVPLAILLFLLGGSAWVVWGISVRVVVSISGHWFIGYLAHNGSHRRWHVESAAVQGYNVPLAGLVTMGESWHNNHHAFPGSAKLGHTVTEADPGWWVLILLAKCGLVWDLKLPEDLEYRSELKRL